MDVWKSIIWCVGLCAVVFSGGCLETSSNNNTPENPLVSEHEKLGDHAIGNVQADIVITEYASVVCGACANWHNTVFPEFKKAYIDTGQIRFIFREFPTNPVSIARTGFLIANCADEDKFFSSISLQFKRQSQIFKAMRQGKVRDEYINQAKSVGLSEADFYACLQDENENKRYDEVIQSGLDAGVNSTPTFFINGRKTSRTPSGEVLFTLESFAEILAPLLAKAPDQSAGGPQE